MGRAGRGGGGFSGGGRSGGGFSSGRSGSGRAGGSGSHRAGFGGNKNSFNSGYSNRPHRSHHHHHHVWPVFFGRSYRRPYYDNGMNNQNYNGNGNGNGNGSRGCLPSLLIIGVLFFIFFIFITIISDGSSSITKSTQKREKLKSQYVNETDYYTDNLNWIKKPSILESGMKEFYNKTGVQPYLYITKEINNKTISSGLKLEDIDVFCEKFYNDNFSDEGHLLVVFVESDLKDENYYSYYYRGIQAKSVIDNEAGDILLDYIDSYYYSDKTEEEMFSLVFSKTADRIMNVTKSPGSTILNLAIFAIIIIVIYKIIKKILNAKKEKQQKVEDILNKPLNTFGDSSADDLADKYEEE